MRRLVLLALLAGCYDPIYPTGLTCGEEGPDECPPGQTCVGGSCWPSGEPGQPDARVGVDARVPDAELPPDGDLGCVLELNPAPLSVSSGWAYNSTFPTTITVMVHDASSRPEVVYSEMGASTGFSISMANAGGNEWTGSFELDDPALPKGAVQIDADCGSPITFIVDRDEPSCTLLYPTSGTFGPSDDEVFGNGPYLDLSVEAALGSMFPGETWTLEGDIDSSYFDDVATDGRLTAKVAVDLTGRPSFGLLRLNATITDWAGNQCRWTDLDYGYDLFDCHVDGLAPTSGAPGGRVVVDDDTDLEGVQTTLTGIVDCWGNRREWISSVSTTCGAGMTSSYNATTGAFVVEGAACSISPCSTTRTCGVTISPASALSTGWSGSFTVDIDVAAPLPPLPSLRVEVLEPTAVTCGDVVAEGTVIQAQVADYDLRYEYFASYGGVPIEVRPDGRMSFTATAGKTLVVGGRGPSVACEINATSSSSRIHIYDPPDEVAILPEDQPYTIQAAVANDGPYSIIVNGLAPTTVIASGLKVSYTFTPPSGAQTISLTETATGATATRRIHAMSFGNGMDDMSVELVPLPRGAEMLITAPTTMPGQITCEARYAFDVDLNIVGLPAGVPVRSFKNVEPGGTLRFPVPTREGHTTYAGASCGSVFGHAAGFRKYTPGVVSSAAVSWGELGVAPTTGQLGVGDVDGDGAQEIVFANPQTSHVRVFRLRPSSLVETTLFDVANCVDAPIDTGLGLAVRDLDGDGAAEVILGIPDTAEAAAANGMVYIARGGRSWHHGERACEIVDARFALSTTTVGARFGASLDVGGVDGIGAPDIIVAAPGAGAIYVIPNPQDAAGPFFVNSGSALEITIPGTTVGSGLRVRAGEYFPSLPNEEIAVFDPMMPSGLTVVVGGLSASSGSHSITSFTTQSFYNVSGMRGVGTLNGFNGAVHFFIAYAGGAIFVPSDALGSPVDLAAMSTWLLVTNMSGLVDPRRANPSQNLDLDHDGFGDLITTGNLASSDKVVVWHGPEWTPSWFGLSTTNAAPSTGAIGDVDEDGFVDLVVWIPNESGIYLIH